MLVNDLICCMTKILSGTHVRWLGAVPSNTQRIYFANHQSHLDSFVIYSSLPRDVRWKLRAVAGMDYWQRGYFRRYLSHDVFNALLIDRHQSYPPEHPSHPINRMVESIDQGYSLLIFPEGTRNRSACISPFKSGLYYLAYQRPQVELVPVYVENLNRILPKGEYLPVPLMGRVSFGAPIVIKKGEQREEFLDRARKALECLGE